MQHSRAIILLLALSGLLLAVGAPFLPGHARLEAIGPPHAGHVTKLFALPGGDVLAGTQNGIIWRYREGFWTQERQPFGAQAILALLGEPRRTPVGTADGLFMPGHVPPLPGRIGALLQADRHLVAGTPNGVRVLVDGDWQMPGPPASIYALTRQHQTSGDWIHAATMDAGILSAETQHPDRPWQSNNAGLPAGIKPFTFAVTHDGRLLLGTDNGMFWQVRPGQPWQALAVQPCGPRITALHLDVADAAGLQRLWLGCQNGLYSARLDERDGSLDLAEALQAADTSGRQPPLGISWIVPHGDALLISAGRIYRYGPGRLAGWYLMSGLGIAFMLLAGRMAVRRR